MDKIFSDIKNRILEIGEDVIINNSITTKAIISPVSLNNTSNSPDQHSNIGFVNKKYYQFIGLPLETAPPKIYDSIKTPYQTFLFSKAELVRFMGLPLYQFGLLIGCDD